MLGIGQKIACVFLLLHNLFTLSHLLHSMKRLHSLSHYCWHTCYAPTISFKLCICICARVCVYLTCTKYFAPYPIANQLVTQWRISSFHYLYFICIFNFLTENYLGHEAQTNFHLHFHITIYQLRLVVHKNLPFYSIRFTVGDNYQLNRKMAMTIWKVVHHHDHDGNDEDGDSTFPAEQNSLE